MDNYKDLIKTSDGEYLYVRVWWNGHQYDRVPPVTIETHKVGLQHISSVYDEFVDYLDRELDDNLPLLSAIDVPKENIVSAIVNAIPLNEILKFMNVLTNDLGEPIITNTRHGTFVWMIMDFGDFTDELYDNSDMYKDLIKKLNSGEEITYEEFLDTYIADEIFNYKCFIYANSESEPIKVKQGD